MRTMGVALALLAELVGILWWQFNATETNFSGAHFNQHQNAIWAEHAWVGKAHSAQEYDALAALLTREPSDGGNQSPFRRRLAQRAER